MLFNSFKLKHSKSFTIFHTPAIVQMNKIPETKIKKRNFPQQLSYSLILSIRNYFLTKAVVALSFSMMQTPLACMIIDFLLTQYLAKEFSYAFILKIFAYFSFVCVRTGAVEKKDYNRKIKMEVDNSSAEHDQEQSEKEQQSCTAKTAAVKRWKKVFKVFKVNQAFLDLRKDHNHQRQRNRPFSQYMTVVPFHFALDHVLQNCCQLPF
ncbi:hypothetical protein T08_1107 [Trichinella sp. T8]|nr:hypothetical protein T08_1107 [Trichinella sp. T8]